MFVCVSGGSVTERLILAGSVCVCVCVHQVCVHVCMQCVTVCRQCVHVTAGFQTFDRFINCWSAGFKTSPVYAKSKSGSISWLARSKSGPVHALDGLPPCVRGQQSFRVPNKSYWKEAAKQSGNDASQFFFKLVLALLVRLAGASTNASSDRFSIRSALALVGSCSWDVYLACNLPAYFSKSFGQQSYCLGYGLFVWQVCTALIPFGLFVNHSANFQAIRPAFKLFSLVYKWHTSLWKRANQFKNWMTGL